MKIRNIINYIYSLDCNYVFGCIKSVIFGKHNLLKYKVNGLSILIRGASFRSQYNDIFLLNSLYVKTNNSRPVILDLGANVGIASIYYKKLFPDAEIHAYEADPEIFKILKKNIESNSLNNVHLYNYALWKKDEDMGFCANGLGGGYLTNLEDSRSSFRIKGVDIKNVLNELNYDVIKMDIEGAENELIPYCIDELCKAEALIIEYHSRKDKPQSLSYILDLFCKNGFRYYIRQEDLRFNPFINPDQTQYDNRVAIYLIKGNRFHNVA